MLTVAELGVARLQTLLVRYGLQLVLQAQGTSITASYWGDPEAGIAGREIYARGDTPVHSVLHEAAHVICMPGERRDELFRDAGGSDLEEAAVCYLQIVLADHVDGVGRDRLLRDMDVWGYSFRLGSARDWFERDAEDSRNWLIENKLLENNAIPTFQLRA